MFNSTKAWTKNHPTLRALLHLPGNLIAPIRSHGLAGVVRYRWFVADWLRFRRSGGGAHLLNWRPLLSERTSEHGIDPHYFFQAVWAARLVAEHRPDLHYDVGSQAVYVGMLTAFVHVKFIDIRPLGVAMPNYDEERGSILRLPMGSESVESISSLHVIEHIGLGRYGDPIDPSGTAKAARELCRVLTPGGRLYLSLPIGRERVEFNAHRVHNVGQVMGMFEGLTLTRFSVVSDDGVFHADVRPSGWDNQSFACGMFYFTKGD